MESEKKKFAGHEIQGKTLGVIGLGHIGSSVSNAAINLGMHVVGFDPCINIDSAWKLPGHGMERASTLEEVCSQSDYITIHIPYMSETHHIINSDLLKIMKPNSHLINFSRGELVDTRAMKNLYDCNERLGRYVSDFPDKFLVDEPRSICIPHLGASTTEAEENAASMAARQIDDYIQYGNITNSVNFPHTHLSQFMENTRRITVVNRNVPGMLGLIMSTIGNNGANIFQQINTSHEDIAYNILDVCDSIPLEKISKLQSDLSKLEGVISSRVLFQENTPNFFFRSCLVKINFFLE